MKRAFVIMAAIMALVVVAAAPLALAAPGKSKPAKPNQGQGNTNGAKKRYRPFTANGLVVEVGSGSFTMKVWSGGKMRRERGKAVVIKVTDKTRIWRVDVGKRTTVELGDMQAKERVWVAGTFVTTDDGREYTARRVKLKASWPFMVKGTVEADGVDVSAGTIKLKVTRSMVAMRPYVGNVLTFQTSDTTRLLKRADGVTSVVALGDIQPGDTVVVNGRVDNSAPDAKVFNAKRVLVKG